MSVHSHRVAPTGHYAPGEEPTAEAFEKALHEVARALEGTGLQYLLMGGVGTRTIARPRVTDDIDLFVTPEDAPRVLDELAAAGFDTEIAEPSWLYKAHRHGVLVDVIFRSSGDVYLDDQMLARAVHLEVKGARFPVISPEDLLVIKAVASSEVGPHHWYDALAIIARGDLDWDYLVTRARRAGPRRVLSLLLYAESNDVAIPIDPVRQLLADLYPGLTTP
ncbi:MAG TPA: nucleotidyltransferase [Acidimicrobiales bacterium]